MELLWSKWDKKPQAISNLCNGSICKKFQHGNDVIDQIGELRHYSQSHKLHKMQNIGRSDPICGQPSSVWLHPVLTVFGGFFVLNFSAPLISSPASFFLACLLIWIYPTPLSFNDWVAEPITFQWKQGLAQVGRGRSYPPLICKILDWPSLTFNSVPPGALSWGKNNVPTTGRFGLEQTGLDVTCVCPGIFKIADDVSPFSSYFSVVQLSLSGVSADSVYNIFT